MRIPLVVLAAACSAPRPAPVPPATPPIPAQVPPPTPAVATTPSTRTVAVVDHQFGLDIADPYRWMEGLDNAEYTSWQAAQGEAAAKDLAKLPGRAALYARIRELGLGVGAVYDLAAKPDRTFYRFTPAGEQTGELRVRERDGRDRVLVSPSHLSQDGSHVSLNAYSISPDGKLVAYVLTAGGGEMGVLHIMDVATGKELPDQLERIWGEGAGSWLPDSSGLFYTQLPPPGAPDPMADQVTRLHRLHHPTSEDVSILDREPGATMKLESKEWPGLWVPPGSTYVMAFVGGSQTEQRISVAKLADVLAHGHAAAWKQLSTYTDGVDGAVIHGDRIYFSTFKDAPNRRLLSVPVADPVLAHARVELPERADAPLAGWYSARDAVYAVYRVDGRAELVRWPWRGAVTKLQLPESGWIPDGSTDLSQDGITFQLETWLAPGAYYRYDAAHGKLAPTGIASTTKADSSQLVVDEVEAVSADGTKVPLSILHAKNIALDGSHPTILYGYGAYGSSSSPGYGATRLAWLELGGVFAIAHVRGGGERGRAWQDAGSREHKLNGIADFLACGRYLIDHKYTQPSHLAADGASLGGILVGRSLVEDPKLFAAVHIGSGFVNGLRLLHAENGANQIAEVGDPATETGYRNLFAMDPYSHVMPATPYPAVIFTVGVHDHRVAPWMSGKMAARLRASSTSGHPIWIRVDGDAGHGIGSQRDQVYAERADVWSFFLAMFARS